MKKILALVFVLAAIAQANANEVDPKSPVGMAVVKSGTIVKLFYRGEQSGKVKVTIYNHKGDVVFKEVMQHTEHFMRPYNFASLPEGEYTIELNDGSGKRFQNVTYTKPKLERIAYLTRLDKEENKYMLAVRNHEKDVLTVRIYNQHNAVIFQETEKVNGDFAKVYNLNSVIGNPTFEVIDKKGNATRLTKAPQ
jgi:hypothetical protein